MTCLIKKKISLQFEKIDYYIFIILAIIFAVGVEIRAGIENLWTYNDLMPVIFGMGITPLVQLAITGVITLLLTKQLLYKE